MTFTFFAFHSQKIVVSCHRVKNRKFLWYNSVDVFTLVGTVFCRSNRKQSKRFIGKAQKISNPIYSASGALWVEWLAHSGRWSKKIIDDIIDKKGTGERSMIQYKVLIIEDDLNAAQSISNFLSAWGFQCEYLKDFGQVTDQFISFRPEIVLLDITLPHYNGYHWCEEIRKISKVPIIFISSINDNLNMILAMNMGGDDFVVKPFDLNFLLAKINSLLRRTYDFQGAMNVVACGDVVLDLDNAKLQYKGRILELSRNDFIILKELMTHSGKNVSRDELMQALWNDNTFVDDNTLTVNVTRVRNKLRGIGLEDFIVTRKGMGYQVG